MRKQWESIQSYISSKVCSCLWVRMGIPILTKLYACLHRSTSVQYTVLLMAWQLYCQCPTAAPPSPHPSLPNLTHHHHHDHPTPSPTPPVPHPSQWEFFVFMNCLGGRLNVRRRTSSVRRSRRPYPATYNPLLITQYPIHSAPYLLPNTHYPIPTT